MALRNDELLGSKEGGEEDELLDREEDENLLGGREVKDFLSGMEDYKILGGKWDDELLGGRGRRMARFLAARSPMRTGGNAVVQCCVFLVHQQHMQFE